MNGEETLPPRSYDPETSKPVLAAGGARGIVRLFSPANMSCVRCRKYKRILLFEKDQILGTKLS